VYSDRAKQQRKVQQKGFAEDKEQRELEQQQQNVQAEQERQQKQAQQRQQQGNQAKQRVQGLWGQATGAVGKGWRNMGGEDYRSPEQQARGVFRDVGNTVSRRAGDIYRGAGGEDNRSGFEQGKAAMKKGYNRAKAQVAKW
jgi:hypothetical protein